MNLQRIAGLSGSHLAALAAGVTLSATLSTGEVIAIKDPRVGMGAAQLLAEVDTVHLRRSAAPLDDAGQPTGPDAFRAYEAFFKTRPLADNAALDVTPRRLSGDTSEALRPLYEQIAGAVVRDYCSTPTGLDAGTPDCEPPPVASNVRVMVNCGDNDAGPEPCLSSDILVPGATSTRGHVYQPSAQESAQILDVVRQSLLPAWCAAGGYCPEGDEGTL